ncbi:MAG: HPP family protein [Dehalococcoidales bacterium]
MFLAFLFLNTREIIIIASIGATAFIVFTMPGSISAQPRSVIGGHIIGILSGSVFTMGLQNWINYPLVIYSIAVGSSIFLMVATDTEHPPASGTALGIAINGYSTNVLIAVIASATLMALAHHFLKRYMKKLTR